MFLTNLLDFTKRITPLALMASESIANPAFQIGPMGYWLRAQVWARGIIVKYER